ncbi:MAG: preprotein translocase subunit YajC [Bacilli bacterium]|nr:preprotein translocase subunit YajC [Bacilli bacterium]
MLNLILQQDLTTAIITFVVPLAIFILVMYFFIMKPEKKKRQEVMEMQSKVKKDDKIVTIGGIYGIVDEVKEDTATIILVSGARMKIEKSAIKRIISEE